MSARLKTAVAAVLTCGTLLWSCGETTLSGSLGELFPLDVSRVEVRRNDFALQVTYMRNRGVFLDVVARVAVSLEEVELTPGTRIPLEGRTTSGARRATVVHAPGGEPMRNLPDVEKGDLVVTEGGGIEEMTKGNFSMVFAQEGGDLGQGRTLVGSFAGVALDAGYGPLP